MDALASLLAAVEWKTLRVSDVERHLEGTLLPHLPCGWSVRLCLLVLAAAHRARVALPLLAARPSQPPRLIWSHRVRCRAHRMASRRHALLAAIERVLASDIKPPPPKRTKHRLLSSSAARDAKRQKNGASRDVLLSKPLLRSNITTGGVLPSLSTFLKGMRRQLASVEDAHYVLLCLSTEVSACTWVRRGVRMCGCGWVHGHGWDARRKLLGEGGDSGAGPELRKGWH